MVNTQQTMESTDCKQRRGGIDKGTDGVDPVVVPSLDNRKRKSQEKEKMVKKKRVSKRDQSLKEEEEEEEEKEIRRRHDIDTDDDTEEQDEADGENNEEEEDEEDVQSEASSTSTIIMKKKKNSSTTTSSAFKKLLEIEDKAPLCVLGETESNMLPKWLKFMNHRIDVMYDSRVHMWYKADDVAKALGYKNYKAAIDRYVDSSFVRSFPEVLDMSRARFGDAYRLYSVNTKTQFINVAGFTQLLLRNMISEENDINKQGSAVVVQQQQQQQGGSTVPSNRSGKQQTKPKLSAEWINYQILPSLFAFSDATRNGVTAKEKRRGGKKN